MINTSSFTLLRRPDSNERPPGYEPGELPTAPLRDVVFLIRCKGMTFLNTFQIFMAFFLEKDDKE